MQFNDDDKCLKISLQSYCTKKRNVWLCFNRGYVSRGISDTGHSLARTVIGSMTVVLD